MTFFNAPSLHLIQDLVLLHGYVDVSSFVAQAITDNPIETKDVFPGPSAEAGDT